MNRIENKSGDITIKLVKMGVDIDKENNHRVRGIVPTDKGHYVFVEFSLAHRITRENFKTNNEKKEWYKKHPESEYIFCDHCFRVDSPIDFYNNFSKEYKHFEKPYYNIKYNKQNIIKLLKKLNKNIKNIKLEDKNYIDRYCYSNGFYELYDKRLNHKTTLAKIREISNNMIVYDVNYRYTNYNHTETSVIRRRVTEYNYKLEHLKKQFGSQRVTSLIDEYNKKNNNLFKHNTKILDNEQYKI